MKHTPYMISSTFLVCDVDARIVANCQPMTDVPSISFSYAEAAENAAFIVKACNSHDDLVEACKAMLKAIEGPACCTALDANGNDAWPQINKAASMMRDAIAKAEGHD